MNERLASIAQIQQTGLDLAVRFGPRLLVAILILAAGVITSRWVRRWVLKALARLELEPPVRLLLARVGWLLCFALFAILSLQNLGVELLPLIAGLSVIGAGVALATQGVLGNLVAGLSIIFTKPFRVGQYISILGKEGTVDTITLFSTTLLHTDLSRVVIPNRKIVGEILHNYGHIRQLDLAVGVGYESDLAAIFAAIHKVLEDSPRVLKEPVAVVGTTALGEWSVTIAVRPWVAVADYVAATGELNAALLEGFRARHISIPLPQREVRLLGNVSATG
ncbi:MAG TPA: mechanosensitive ion channel family protein [Steroidobacteraceae bacterium]|nr:mechanosensitive ion channel family protein [Steroidobacteraceae bacterium]